MFIYLMNMYESILKQFDIGYVEMYIFSLPKMTLNKFNTLHYILQTFNRNIHFYNIYKSEI